ncbi:MAG: patatin-like phospholipase family protein [Flavobacteriales bacterium]|nr:patatin-like phospholipase family protein [Flavobacteriales bacterium]
MEPRQPTGHHKAPFVLSGGGARGFAHLGVLEACAEFGIVPGAISATSAGALVGAYIAAGLAPGEVVDLMRSRVPGIFSRWRILRGDRLTQNRIRSFLEATLPVERIEQLHMPFFVSTTDLATGRQCLLHEGGAGASPAGGERGAGAVPARGHRSRALCGRWPQQQPADRAFQRPALRGDRGVCEPAGPAQWPAQLPGDPRPHGAP